MSVVAERSWMESHVVVPSLGPCAICASETHFMEPGFETYLHPGTCTTSLWEEYLEACRASDARLRSEGYFDREPDLNEIPF